MSEYLFTRMFSGPRSLEPHVFEVCSDLAATWPSDPTRLAIQSVIWGWENQDTSTFGGKSPSRSRARREEIYTRLGLRKEEVQLFDSLFDPAPALSPSSPSKAEILRKVQKQLTSDNYTVVSGVLLLHHQLDPSIRFEVDETGCYIVGSQLCEVWKQVSGLPLSGHFKDFEEADQNVTDFFQELAEGLFHGERWGGPKEWTEHKRLKLPLKGILTRYESMINLQTLGNSITKIIGTDHFSIAIRNRVSVAIECEITRPFVVTP